MANTSSYEPIEMIDCDFLCIKSFAIAVVARGRGAGVHHGEVWRIVCSDGNQPRGQAHVFGEITYKARALKEGLRT